MVVAVLLLTIALGVGSNVSVFGFVQGLLRPNPNLSAKDEDHIVSIFARDNHYNAVGQIAFLFKAPQNCSNRGVLQEPVQLFANLVGRDTT